MLRNRRTEILVAYILVAPFVLLYAWMFIYPTIQMVRLSFTDAPVIGTGKWIGLANYVHMFKDPTFRKAIWNTGYFVLLTVVPGTAVALAIAMMVSRMKGWLQSLILSAFFLPCVLPVTVVYLIWDWLTNLQFGMLQAVIEPLAGKAVNVWRTIPWFMPGVAVITIWWTNGFSILQFQILRIRGQR
jgi:multiple sugar transport system permease protein